MNAGTAAVSPAGGAESVSKGTVAVLSFIFIMGVGWISGRFAVPALAFALVPLPLLAFRFTTWGFLVYYFGVNLFFFEMFRTASNFYFLQTADACLIVFLTLYFIKRHTSFVFAFPKSGVLAAFYVFLGYVFVMSIGPLLAKGGEHWLLYDVRRFAVLATAVFFCSQPIFGPRKIVALLAAIVFITDLCGLGALFRFFLTGARQITWNEIYFSNMFIVSIAVFPLIRNRKLRIGLGASALILGCSMLAAQTRSIWLSSAACTIFYLAFQFRRVMHRIDMKKLMRTVLFLLAAVLAVEVAMKVTIHSGIETLVTKRMTDFKQKELVSPLSSMGYRMYESYTVWTKRTFLGHGTGAYLYLIQTMYPDKKFMHWWSIHCEYMEVLHKWGFAGLALYGLFLGVFLLKSFRMFFSNKQFISTVGAVTTLTVLNTAVISITSGYMFRVNMLMWNVLMVCLVAYYGNRGRGRGGILKA